MKLLLVVLISLALPGCEFYSKGKPVMSEVWPAYQVPARPKLDIPATIVPNKSPELDSMIKNVYTLTSYCETLEIMLETHNAAANAHNKKVSQDLGIGQK